MTTRIITDRIRLIEAMDRLRIAVRNEEWANAILWADRLQKLIERMMR